MATRGTRRPYPCLENSGVCGMRMRFGHVVLVLTTTGFVVAGVVLANAWVARSRLLTPEKIVALAKARDFAGAEAGLKSYLAFHPDDGKALILMAQIATDRPDAEPELALDHLRRVRPNSPKQAALARFFEGKAHYLLKRYDLAEANWREALRLDPKVPEAGWALVDLLDLEGRSEEAHRVGMTQHEVEPNPLDRVSMLLELSRIDIDKVAPGSIVQNFEALQRQRPDNLVLGVVVGLALVHDSRGEQGLVILEDTLRRHPEDPDAWDAWLTGLDEAAQNDRFARECARLPKAMASSLRFAKHEGRLAQIRRDWNAAVRAYGRAYEAEPYDGVVLYRFRHVLRLAGNTAEADRINRALAAYQAAFKDLHKFYEQAKKVSAGGEVTRLELYRRLATMREQMGRRDEALAWNRLILEDLPKDPRSLAAIERLK
jgi:tetratricopeptide (TPR) repeat protein